jgi:hypothetical protein
MAEELTREQRLEIALQNIVTLAREPAVSGLGPWKRMPPELRSAIEDGAKALAPGVKEPNNPEGNPNEK